MSRVGQRKVEHSPKTIARARQLHAEGKALKEIVFTLAAEGTPATKTTIRVWTDEDYAARRAEQRAKAMRRWRNPKRPLQETAFELHRRRVPYSVIPTILDLYHDVSVSEHTVRRWCYEQGAQKNPVRVAQAGQLRRAA